MSPLDRFRAWWNSPIEHHDVFLAAGVIIAAVLIGLAVFA